ncbi:hypothetical protein CYLTODRAFT_416776 [Cylindrobasidium torrendii FP15055 ss-10]|uniref:Cytoplasmic protein n=1 Tax=Cylindrobasidium torrendii FP15055 ss-10 TaxID=1314674 RepID=A0A0D7BTN1_9AGAR|nr:hypothetical protein CYLTODRAFT_416776 [Cylindrobasidium torrendii FP15055 ss-10]
MRTPRRSLFLPTLAFVLLSSLPLRADASTSDAVLLSRAEAHEHNVHEHKMNMHEHVHSGTVLEHWNETLQLETHAPTPPSYFTLDFDNVPETEHKYTGLMFLHGLLMGLAFFVSLPAGIALRSVKHAWHGIAVASFYGFIAMGCASSALYTKLSPHLYEGQAHSRQGYLTILVAASLTIVDLLSIIRRIFAFVRSRQKFQLRTFWNSTILGRDETWLKDLTPEEYVGLVSEEPEEIELDDSGKGLASPTSSERRVHYDERTIHGSTAQWANDVNRAHSVTSERTLLGSRSMHSDDTLDVTKPSYRTAVGWKQRIGNAVFATVERSLVIAGFALVISGIVVYTGGCRENYITGCLAHLIKGGIFWCYGLLTFARYLGAYSDLGWSWNAPGDRSTPTAEFVEALVITLYGCTNTWLERLGALPGSPYTTKQIQHIGIAVMFWFAGLIGMALESKRLRRWVSTMTVASLPASVDRNSEAVAEPPSYRGSFNPFPALVIGVTGTAMAAHFQPYRFQVEIHMLWGNLLAGFAVLRFLTYFFLWLNPPRSLLPSRPPTEALASFCLAAGGMAFMLSTEEVTIAAMRRGRDDSMMFANVTVAITCLAFCWLVGVVGFKAFLRTRSSPKVSFHDTA